MSIRVLLASFLLSVLACFGDKLMTRDILETITHLHQKSAVIPGFSLVLPDSAFSSAGLTDTPHQFASPRDRINHDGPPRSSMACDYTQERPTLTRKSEVDLGDRRKTSSRGLHRILNLRSHISYYGPSGSSMARVYT